MNYAQRKAIRLTTGETGGAYLDGANVVVPIYDLETREVIGSQRIQPDGKKLYSTGLHKSERTGLLIGPETKRLIIAEGWATACAVYKFTGDQALFALDSGNLPHVCKWLKRHFPNRELIVAADNDVAGQKAAMLSGLPWSQPSELNDWDDVLRAEGAEAAKEQFDMNLTPPPKNSGRGLISGDSLIAKEFEPVPYIYGDIIPAVGLTLIAGAPKEGKSWLALQIHSELAESGLQSLYIGFEDNERRLQQRFKYLSCTAPQNALFLPGITPQDDPFPRGTEALDALRNIKAENPGLACIMLDTVASIRLISGQDKSYEVVVDEWSALRSLAHELGLALIAVHHTRKTNQNDQSPLERILGSQGIAATAETCMILTGRVGSRDKGLFVTGKDVEQQDLLLEWLDPGFEIVKDDQRHGLGPRQLQIYDLIQNIPNCTQAKIIDAAKIDKGQLSNIVSRLSELGFVKKLDDGILVGLAS